MTDRPREGATRAQTGFSAVDPRQGARSCGSPALRAAGPEDVAALVELERRAFGPDAWAETAVSAELDVGAVIVATVDQTLVGYAAVRVPQDVADLTRIAVLPEHRRSGFGRALLAEAERWAAANGADRMLLEVSTANDEALAFYAAEGLVEIDRRHRYYPDGTDAVVLRVGLGPACGGG